jgi:hypothetical protein
MRTMLVLLGLVGLGLGSVACKAKECPGCTCDGGGGAAAVVAPAAGGVGPAQQPASPATGAKAPESAAGDQPGAAAVASKCTGAGCVDRDFAEDQPGGGTRPGDVAPPLSPPVTPLAPVVPTDVPPAGPLAPGLAAHLTRLPSAGELVLVVQADVRALLSPADVRAALGPLLEMLRGEVQGDPACLAELAASIDLVTVQAVEFDGGGDTAVAIVEGNVDLPGLLECAATLVPDEFPRELVGRAAGGYVELDDDFGLATLGPRTVAFGGPELLRQVRSGRVARPLSASTAFEAARRAAGAGPAYFVALVQDDDRGGRNDESFTGGAVLRTTPRLGVTGSFAFAVPEMAGEVIAEFAEMLTELDQEQAEVLGALREMPGGETIVGDATKLFKAVRESRVTLQDRTVSFEVWVSEGATPAGLASSMMRAVPWLLFSEAKVEESAHVREPVPAVAVP